MYFQHYITFNILSDEVVILSLQLIINDLRFFLSPCYIQDILHILHHFSIMKVTFILSTWLIATATAAPLIASKRDFAEPLLGAEKDVSKRDFAEPLLGAEKDVSKRDFAEPLLGAEKDVSRRDFAEPLLGAEKDVASKRDFAEPLLGAEKDVASKRDFAEPLLGAEKDVAA